MAGTIGFAAAMHWSLSTGTANLKTGGGETEKSTDASGIPLSASQEHLALATISHGESMAQGCTPCEPLAATLLPPASRHARSA
jgi:hypothetical protein